MVFFLAFLFFVCFAFGSNDDGVSVRLPLRKASLFFKEQEQQQQPLEEPLNQPAPRWVSTLFQSLFSDTFDSSIDGSSGHRSVESLSSSLSAATLVSEALQLLSSVVNHGSQLYNSGRADQCANLYRDAALQVAGMLTTAGLGDLAEVLLEEVQVASQMSANDAAWALRSVFDNLATYLMRSPYTGMFAVAPSRDEQQQFSPSCSQFASLEPRVTFHPSGVLVVRTAVSPEEQQACVKHCTSLSDEEPIEPWELEELEQDQQGQVGSDSSPLLPAIFTTILPALFGDSALFESPNARVRGRLVVYLSPPPGADVPQEQLQEQQQEQQQFQPAADVPIANDNHDRFVDQLVRASIREQEEQAQEARPVRVDVDDDLAKQQAALHEALVNSNGSPDDALAVQEQEQDARSGLVDLHFPTKSAGSRHRCPFGGWGMAVAVLFAASCVCGVCAVGRRRAAARRRQQNSSSSGDKSSSRRGTNRVFLPYARDDGAPLDAPEPQIFFPQNKLQFV